MPSTPRGLVQYFTVMNKGGRRWVVLLVAALAVVLLMSLTTPERIQWVIAARFPSVSWIDARTLSRWMDDARRKPILLDVRSKEEYEVSHLRGARRVDPKQPDLGSLQLPEDATVVVYCSVGYRSAAIVDDLRQWGVDEVYNLTGGIFGWANEGRPLFRDGTQVEVVHPFAQRWAWLVREDLRAD